MRNIERSGRPKVTRVPICLLRSPSSSRSLSLPFLSVRTPGFGLAGKWKSAEGSDIWRRIGRRSANRFMRCLGAADDMNLEKLDLTDDRKGRALASCSICLEFVVDRGERSTAKLQCGHEFHLDCIGSAFNAKGAMQCPNCRKVEKGRWLYANGHRPSTDFDLDGWIPDDIYDLTYSELPLGFQWCPFGGFTQLASLFEDVESQLNLFHEPLGGNTFGDHSSASGSSHACPYLALHGFPHNMHAARSSSDTLQENSPFHQHSTSLTGHSSSERLNPQSFPATESQSHSWQPQPPAISMSLVGNSEQPSQYGLRSSRNDAGNQQRLGSFVQSHPFIHGSVAARSGSNNVLTGAMGLPVIGEVRAHARGHGSHMYQQSISSSSLRSSPFPHIRRSRPRGLTFISSSASNDVNGFYGFSVSSSTRNPQDSGRHFDRFFGWSREGFAPLPLVQLEGESQWWGPFNQAHSGSYLQRGGNAGDRVAQNRSENGYHQRMPPHNRMPPPPPPPYM